MNETIEQIFARKIGKIFDVSPHGYQKEIAEAVGISVTRMNNIVRGRRGSDEDLRRKICDELGIKNYEQFIFGNSNTQLNPDLLEIFDLLEHHATPALLRDLKKRLLEMKERDTL